MDPAHTKYRRTDIWREGEYLDLWSVPHFFSGICVALGLTMLGFGILSAAFIGFILLVLYEVFEWWVDIEETRANRVLDVVVGMTSMLPTLPLAADAAFTDVTTLFITITIGNIILSLFGWHASHKAAAFQAALRQDFVRSRERIRAGRARITKRLRIKRKQKVGK